jgi:hypothetical protein
MITLFLCTIQCAYIDREKKQTIDSGKYITDVNGWVLGLVWTTVEVSGCHCIK